MRCGSYRKWDRRLFYVLGNFSRAGLGLLGGLLDRRSMRIGRGQFTQVGLPSQGIIRVPQSEQFWVPAEAKPLIFDLRSPPGVDFSLQTVSTIALMPIPARTGWGTERA
jgi:hypothetical protein